MVKIYFEDNNYSQNKSYYSMPALWLTHYAWVSCMWTYLDIDFTCGQGQLLTLDKQFQRNCSLTYD